MATSKVSKAEQAEATTSKLIQIARDHFAKHGYANAATEDIVAEAGVTRGALYHHFGNKEGLFRAVVADLQATVAQQVDGKSSPSSAWEQLVVGCEAFLSSALDPHVRQIMLIDAPSVLGWAAWRAMDEANSMALLKDVLRVLVAKKTLKALPLDALTRLLSGAMNEGALWIAYSDNPQKALEEAKGALRTILEGLRA
jgi:AcrR family transcriptional regulator